VRIKIKIKDPFQFMGLCALSFLFVRNSTMPSSGSFPDPASAGGYPANSFALLPVCHPSKILGGKPMRHYWTPDSLL